MGRARNHHAPAVALADDRFAGVVGARRGSGSRLDSPAPTDEQIRRAEALRETAAHGENLQPLLSELAGLTPLNESRPLVRDLLDTVGDQLAAQAEAHWEQTALRVLDCTRVRSSLHAETLLYHRHRRVVHIWPDGENYAQLWDANRTETLCGHELTVDRHYTTPSRTAFAEPNPRLRACKRCAALAADRPEPYETRETMRALPADADAEFKRSLRARVRAGVVRHLNTVGADAEQVVSDARREAREAYVDALAAEATRRCAQVLARTMDTGSGHRGYVTEMLGFDRSERLSCEQMAAWWNTSVWHEQLDKVFPDQPRQISLDSDVWRRRVSRETIRLGCQALGRELPEDLR